MLKFFKSWLFYIMFIWILACQGLFILIQESFGQKVIDSIQGQLRQELAVSNFNFLARSINDFTVSGAIECGVLDKISPTNQRIIDLRYMSQNCSLNRWALDGVDIKVKLKSLNGDVYAFQFISKNPELFYLALWGFRILGGIAILGIAVAVKASARSEMEIANKMKSMALQVSHDIRSPLSALKMILREQEFKNKEERKVIHSSLERIQDIANNLLQYEKNCNGYASKSNLIVPMIESVISEKRYQFCYIDALEFVTDFGSDYFLCTNLNDGLFKRILSNIINNSIEASFKSYRIDIKVSSYSGWVEIVVKDHGVGIPSELINKIGTSGFTSKRHEKEAGTGIGLSSAIEIIRNAGGDLVVKSKEGEGTEVVMKLPLSPLPEWFISEIHLDRYEEIWIIDDDPTIHHLWRRRIGQKINAFSEIDSFKNHYLKSEKKERLYLVDYELGKNQTGLDLVEELGLSRSSVLVTTVFEDSHIQEKVLRNGMRIVPKFLIDQVNLIESSEGYYDVIYIDDDFIMRLGWENQAKKKDIKILTISSPDEFFNYSDRISKDKTSIYIDSNLGAGSISGEEFACSLHANGYHNLFLATGYNKEEFNSYPWLKIQGKEFPF